MQSTARSLQRHAKTRRKVRFKKYLPFYLMGLPGLAYLLVNNYMPLAGLQIAFKKFNYALGMWDSPWAGLENFRYLFASQDAWIITRNTLAYNFVFIIVNMAVGIAAAIFLNEIRSQKSKQFFQTAILLPYLMSMVVIAYLAYAFLSGSTGFINNHILAPLGLQPVEFYMESSYWPFILVFINTWKGLGFGMVIYLSTLVGISGDYYEAATIDGASKWQQIRKITLPLLKPTAIMLVTLAMGNIFRSDFGLFYQVPMNQGMLFSVTQTIDTYVYRGLMVNNKITMSAAAGFYQSIVGFVCILSMNALVRKMSKENALF